MWGGNSLKDKSSKKLPVPLCCQGQHLQPSPSVQCPSISSANLTNSTSKDDAQACANQGRNGAGHPWEERRGLPKATDLQREDASAPGSAQHSILPAEILAEDHTQQQLMT